MASCPACCAACLPPLLLHSNKRSCAVTDHQIFTQLSCPIATPAPVCHCTLAHTCLLRLLPPQPPACHPLRSVCTTNSQCNDGNANTVDRCINNECVYTVRCLGQDWRLHGEAGGREDEREAGSKWRAATARG